jgi:hypothetical protein
MCSARKKVKAHQHSETQSFTGENQEIPGFSSMFPLQADFLMTFVVGSIVTSALDDGGAYAT